MKPSSRRLVLAAALVGSAALALWGDRGAAGAIEPAPRVAQQLAAARAASNPPQAVLPATAKAERAPPANVDLPDVKDRSALIGREPGQDAGGRLFQAVLPPPPRAVAAVVTVEPAAPPALPYAYLGKQHDGTQWQLFLKRDNGDAVVVREGEAIDADYRVDELTATRASIVYLPMHHTHVLSFE